MAYGGSIPPTGSIKFKLSILMETQKILLSKKDYSFKKEKGYRTVFFIGDKSKLIDLGDYRYLIMCLNCCKQKSSGGCAWSIRCRITPKNIILRFFTGPNAVQEYTLPISLLEDLIIEKRLKNDY